MAGNNHGGYFYEAEPACGMVYLTVDSSPPFYIGFHHKIRLEIKLDHGKHAVSEQSHHQPLGKVILATSDTGTRTTDMSGSEPTNDLNNDISHLLDKSTVGEVKEDYVVSSDAPSPLCEDEPIDTSERHDTKLKRKSKRNTGIASGAVELTIKARKGRKGKPVQTRKMKMSEKMVEKQSKKKASISRAVRKKAKGRKTTKQHGVKSSQRQGKTGKVLRQSCSDTSERVTEEELDIDGGDINDESCEEESKDETMASTVKTPQKLTCEFCFKSFSSRREFFSHRRSKTSAHTCSTCGKVFPFRAHLLVHMREHRSYPNKTVKTEEKFMCDVCGLDSKNLTRLKKHMLIHTGEFYYKCCVCDRSISGFGAMNNHMVSHKNAGMIKCNCCDQYFVSRAELSKHQLALLEIKCNLCGEVFPNRTSRTVHYKLAHPDNILRCPICSFMFSSDKELSSHMIYHTKYKKKQCTTCGKFVSRLERHVLTHKSLKDIDESELFICDKCPMKFMLKSSLQRHQRIHSQERPFSCNQCPKSFACRSVLLKHIKTHSSVMPYECEVCGKRCKEKSNLKVHMRIHSDTKAFPCTICTQAFSYKSSLEGHMRSKHSLEKSSSQSKKAAVNCYAGAETKTLVGVGEYSAAAAGSDAANYSTVLIGDKEYTQVSGSIQDFTTLQCRNRDFGGHVMENAGPREFAASMRKVSSNRPVADNMFPDDPRMTLTRGSL